MVLNNVVLENIRHLLLVESRRLEPLEFSIMAVILKNITFIYLLFNTFFLKKKKGKINKKKLGLNV